MMPRGTELENLLDALDRADAGVRELYAKLAENPDLASEFEPGLRELHRKRSELAHEVGVAALGEWREARRAREAGEPVARADRASGAVVGELAVTRESEAAPVPPEARPSDLEVPATEAVQPSQSTEAPSGEVSAASAAPPSAQPSALPSSPSPLPAPPASNAQLAEWKRAVQQHGLGAAAMPAKPPQRPWGASLHEMMCLLGPPEVDLNDAVALLEELDALEEIATPERQKLWVRFPIEIQKRWLSHLVARTRAIREHPSSDGVMDRLKGIRAVYPQWAREYVPGHINGLQLKHAPIHETWAKDAEDNWRALVVALGPSFAARVTSSTPKKRREKPRTNVEDEPAVVESDWPLLPVVQGKTVLIVGGEPKEPNRERLEAYFKLASLDWPVVDGPRKVDAVAQRVARGSYDVVLVILTLVAHKESERILEAAKESNVPWAMVEGYGAASVRSGMERFLRPAIGR